MPSRSREPGRGAVESAGKDGRHRGRHWDDIPQVCRRHQRAF